MLGDVARAVSVRPQTSRQSIKSIRYEDAAAGAPPVPVTSINQPVPRPPSSNAAAQPRVTPRRPKTSPSPGSGSPARTPTTIASDIKRDSGIAPSFSTFGRPSYSESNFSSSVAGAAREPTLPTILVQEDESPPTNERNKSSVARQKSKEKSANERERKVTPDLKRVSSFQGIFSDISASTFDDLDLGDLASDKIEFSKRGSLLFGGKKMSRLVDGTGEGSNGPPSPSIPEVSVSEPAPVERSRTPESSSRPGLVAGPRRPSVQMLQAAINGGRVLSAEEITFSMKVRSMYEAGDEKAADWVTPVLDRSPSRNGTGSSTPDASIDDIVVAKRQDNQHDVHPALRSPSPNPRLSYCKEANELAGGIEDWNDVQAEDLDRFGFINQRRLGTPNSVQEGIQRVATSLRVESDQPRKSRGIRRGPSTSTRNSRSLPPRSSHDYNNRVGSMHSVQSQRSVGRLHSGNPFRSRTRKTLDEAGDMLTLPPGLADIEEQDDAGKSASLMKKREWAREAKWQSMARPIQPDPASTRGGGMRFDFDTSDQKLINRTWKGIPDKWRATAWYSFLASSARKRGVKVSDDELIERFHQLQEENSADDVQIDVDVPRTISMHIMFRRRYRGGQRLLFRVLHAISIHFPDTGYVQGMASLAATLLCYYDEEHAFIMMVRLWQLRGLEQLFQPGFEGLMHALQEFEKDWLKGGDVSKQLETLGITSTAYGTRWYLTLFNMSIPFPAQLRVWDAFMLLGDAQVKGSGQFGGADLDVLHATSAALIDATREVLLDSDFENAMKVLTSFVPVKDEDLLMRVARAEWKVRKKRG